VSTPLEIPAIDARGRSEARPLPVVFAVHDPDGAYWLNTAVALTSLAQHARRPISVHVIHDASLSDTAKRRLGEIAQALRVPLALVEQSLPADVDTKVLGHFSPASAFRLMIPSLFSDEDLVVYLDSDLVVNGLDITDLIDEVPAEAPISAVADLFFARGANHRAQMDRLGVPHDRYFNSGVLALRPRLLPKDLPQQFAGFLTSGIPRVHPDQDFLNQLYVGQVHLLDERYNTPIGLIDRRTLKPLSWYRGRILHYVGGIKPFTGVLSPAFVPFLAHSMLTPEIWGGQSYEPVKYLFPADGAVDAVRAKLIDRDPDAVFFYSQLATVDAALPGRLNTFVRGLGAGGVYPYYLGSSLEIRWRPSVGEDVVLAAVDAGGQVRTDVSRAAAEARGRPELADAYERAVAQLSPQGLIADLLARMEDWAAAVAVFTQALARPG
jgi:lipopolysaccharide biosynthesis glycosyltransferase